MRTRDEAAAYMAEWRQQQQEHVYTADELDAAIWFATCGTPQLADEAPTGHIYGFTSRDLEALAWQTRQRAHTATITAQAAARGRAA